MWCNISGEAAEEIWNWSLLRMKGLKSPIQRDLHILIHKCITSINRTSGFILRAFSSASQAGLATVSFWYVLLPFLSGFVHRLTNLRESLANVLQGSMAVIIWSISADFWLKVKNVHMESITLGLRLVSSAITPRLTLYRLNYWTMSCHSRKNWYLSPGIMGLFLTNCSLPPTPTTIPEKPLAITSFPGPFRFGWERGYAGQQLNEWIERFSFQSPTSSQVSRLYLHAVDQRELPSRK